MKTRIELREYSELIPKSCGFTYPVVEILEYNEYDYVDYVKYLYEVVYLI